MPTKEELQDRLNAAYEDVDRLLKQQDAHDEEMAQLEGKIESMREEYQFLTEERDELKDKLENSEHWVQHYSDSYNAACERERALEQKLTYTRTQAEAYLAFILVLKQSLGDQGKR